MDRLVKEELEEKSTRRKKRDNTKEIVELARRIFEEGNAQDAPTGWTNIAERGWENSDFLIKLFYSITNGREMDQENEEEEEITNSGAANQGEGEEEGEGEEGNSFWE